MKKFSKMAQRATSVFVSLTTTLWLAGVGTLVPIATHAQTTADLQAQISALLAQITSLQAQLGTSGGSMSTGAKCTFTRSLTMGSTGEDVRCLQQYLNSAGHTVSATGAGSAGMESTYFGAKTKAAVAKWQAANGVSPAAGYFGPISQAKYNMLVVVMPPTTPPTTPPPTTPGTGTGLTVMAGNHPAATLAPENAIHIPFTQFKLTASADGNVVVDSLTVERGSLANDAAFGGIVLLDENMLPITSIPKTLNSSHQTILSDDFTIPAGQTKTFYLAGNMAASLDAYAGQVATLKLVAVNTTGAQVNGSLPIEGTGHTINGSLSLGSATLDQGAHDPGNVGPTKEVGTTGYIFTGLKITAGSAEEMTLQSIRFNQSGSAAKADLDKVMIVADGTEYPTTVSEDGKYYMASFGGGIVFTKGATKELYVKANIIGGSGRSVDFDLYRYDDVVMKGNQFNYKIQPTSAEDGTTTTADDSEFQSTEPKFDADQVEIGAGSLRVEKSNAVTAGNIADGGKGVAIGAFKFVATGEPVSFASWVMTVTTTGGNGGADLTNVTIYDGNGKAVAGPKDLASDATTITFSDTVEVPVGETIYTVKGDLDTSWANNDTIALSFTPSSGLTTVKGVSTGTTVTPSPASAVAANTQTVKAGTLVITPSSSLSSQNLVEGGVGVELGRFTLDGSASGEDLKITVIKIRANVTSADIDDFQSLQLWDGSTAINTGSNILNPSGNTDGTDATLSFTMDSPGFIVPKGGSKTLSLKGNILTAANTDDTVAFDFSAGVTDGDWGVTGKDSGADVTEDEDTTTAGAVMTIKGGGGWSVEAAPSLPIEKWVAAGATGVTVNVLRFRSTTEDLQLTDLRLQIDATGSSTGSDFAKVYLYDGSTLLASKVPAFTNGVEDFTFPTSGTGSFKIPKDSFKEMTIKVDLENIGNSLPGNAGELVGVDYDGATSSKNKATGQSSGSSVHSSTATDITGNGVVYFRSVPTVERVAIPQTSLTSGNHVLYKFKITADPAYDVALHKVMFKIATTGITGMGASVPSFTLWNITDNKRVGAATGAAAAFFQEQGNYDNSANLVVRIYADTTDYSNAWTTVPKGQTHTFELRGSITSDGTGDSVSTRLVGDDARSPRVTLTGAARRPIGKITFIDADKSVERPGFVNESANVASSSSFIWTDFSSDATTTHALTTADWMNGFRIPGLPSTGLDSSTMSN